MNVAAVSTLVSPSADSDKIEVLLIDERAVIGDALRADLSACPHINFSLCVERADAVALASRICPTVILLGVQASDADALNLIPVFRALPASAAIPIAVLSSNEASPSREDVFAAGADDLLRGGHDVGEILARIRCLAEACAAKRQLEQKTSELEAARKQLVQSEKLASIGLLIAGVAHEINNPIAFVTSNLNSLRGYYEDLFSVIDAYSKLDDERQIDSQQLASVMQLKEKLQLEELQQDVRQVLDECTDGLSRVRKIVDNLRDFSRSGDAEWQWTDLHEQLDRTLGVAANEIKYKAQVNKDYGDLPEIQCMPSQINQVILNLLVNAAQAIDDRGEITIKTCTGTLPKELHEKGARGTVGDGPNAWVCLQISDTGTGIAAETLRQIFDPFFTTKEVGKGTGLGLSVSDGIIQSHGGHIIADSELGTGTTFSVWLPVKQASV